MKDEFYTDYMMIPRVYSVDMDSYFVSLKFIHTLDRFGVMEVRPCVRSRPHGAMRIYIDGAYYNEIIQVWVSRFYRKK